jgi:hypothetical protein
MSVSKEEWMLCQFVHSMLATEALQFITPLTQCCDQASDSAYASPQHCCRHVSRAGYGSCARTPAVETRNTCQLN